MFQLIDLYRRKKKVVVCYRNSGLGDNLFQAASTWLYASKQQRDVLVNWSNSRYLADKSLNAFTHFFSIPDTVAEVRFIKYNRIDLLLKALSIYVPNILVTLLHNVYVKSFKTTDNFLYRWKDTMMKNITLAEKKRIENNLPYSNKILFLRGCLYQYSNELKPFFDALQPSAEIKQLIDEFDNQNFRNKKVIGVHIRYYNKNRIKSDHTKYWEDEQNSLKQISAKINQAISSIGHTDYVLFLATDSDLPYQHITTQFENVVTFKKQFAANRENELHEELPQSTAVATVAEMFLLARSHVLVRYPASWFSYYGSLYAAEVIE